MKRKTYIVDGFKGQNSKDAPEMLAKGECAVLQGGFVNEDSSFDGDQVGTLALKTGLTHEPIIIHHWKSNDGYEYVLTWGSDGIVNYYNKTSSGAVVTDFITGMPLQFPPEFVNWGNEYIIMLAGKFGNYKISSSGGTLTATALATVPPASFARLNAGALYMAQETSIIHSAAGDPLRWVPTREERLAGIYDTAQRLILSSAGVQGETMGYEIWKGFHILWTQYDCYIAAWDGAGTAYATKMPGYGLYGLRGWTVLDDRISFYSTYKQGSICHLVTGTAGANGETFSVGQDIRVSIIEAPGGKKISDILKACPRPTSGKKIIAIDSKEDWEGTKIFPALSTLGFDTTTTPGWVSLTGAAQITLTPIATFGNLVNPGGSVLSDFMAITEDISPANKDVDGAPGPYNATTPTPTANTITMTLTAGCRLEFLKLAGAFVHDGTRQVEFIDKDRKNNGLAVNTGWQNFILEKPIKGIAVDLVWVGQYLLAVSGAIPKRKDIQVVRRYIFPSNAEYGIVKMYIYNYGSNITINTGGAVNTLTLGEVEIWGAQASTGVITTGPSATTSLSIAGLAAGETDLGVFQIGYQGTGVDGTGGLTGATAPTLVEVGIGSTTDPADWGAIDSPTANGRLTYMTAAELLTGTKLSRLLLPLVPPVNATFTPGTGTLATGTYYYRVTALTAAGETTPSAETSLAVTGPVGINVNWGAVTGATGYKIYGRSTGAELYIASVGVVTTYLDNGSITPAGAMPTVNTTAFTFAAGGTLYMRARVPVTLQDGSYASPMIDRLIWDFTTGAARVSTFPMFTWQSKTLLSLMTNSSSTECDKAIAINDNGYCTVFNGVKWMAGCALPDKTIVTAGRTLGELGEGANNLIGSASSDTPTEKVITSPKIKGINKLFARKVKFGISKYLSSGTLTAASTGALVTPDPELTNMSVNPTSESDCNLSVKASDGCIYFLHPYVPTGKTKACYLSLVKFNPATLVITRTDVDAVYVSDNTIKAFSLSLSPDENYIHIFWSGLVTTYSQKFNYKKYDVVAGTLGTVVTVVANLTSSAEYSTMSSLTYTNGDIYCAGYVSTGFVRVYKSTDNGATFVLDKEIGITTSTSNILQMTLNKSGNIVMVYSTTSNLVYTIENTSGIWRTAIAVGATNGTDVKMISTGETDYMFVRGSILSCYYLTNWTWTLITSMSVDTCNITAVVSKNNTVLLFYTTGAAFKCVEFSRTAFTAAKTLTASISFVKLCACPDPTNDNIYLWVFPNAIYWKPYKISVGTMTGTYPLKIIAITENGPTVIYETYKPITKLTYIPERDQDLRLVQGKYLQAKLSTIGQLKCVGLGIEYDEQEGSL